MTAIMHLYGYMPATTVSSHTLRLMGIRKRKRLRRAVQVTAFLLEKAIFHREGSFPVSLPPIILVSLYVYPMQSYHCFRITILIFSFVLVSLIFTRYTIPRICHKIAMRFLECCSTYKSDKYLYWCPIGRLKLSHAYHLSVFTFFVTIFIKTK